MTDTQIWLVVCLSPVLACLVFDVCRYFVNRHRAKLEPWQHEGRRGFMVIMGRGKTSRRK